MRDALIGVVILIVSACSRSTQVTPAPTEAGSTPPVAPPGAGERPPPPAKKLVLAEEKPGDARVALANPLVVVGTVTAVDSVPRCDCEKAKLVVDRILRNDAALRLEVGQPMEVSLPGDELSSLLDKPRTWILRPEPGSTRFAGVHHAPPSATAGIERALSDLAIAYERDDGPLPSFAIVTQKSGAIVWHRHGRIAIKSQLTLAETRAQTRILEGFQTTSAAEAPTAALPTHQPWRLRVEGSGEQGDVKQTEQAVASFAEAVHARLLNERTVWQCSALVRGSLSQQGERSLLRIDRVLHARDATVEVGKDLEVVGSLVTTPAPKLFALTQVHEGRGAVLHTFPSAHEAELERVVAVQQHDQLFAR